MDKQQQAGSQTWQWDASGMASSIYFCRVDAKNKSTGEEVLKP